MVPLGSLRPGKSHKIPRWKGIRAHICRVNARTSQKASHCPQPFLNRNDFSALCRPPLPPRACLDAGRADQKGTPRCRGTRSFEARALMWAAWGANDRADLTRPVPTHGGKGGSEGSGVSPAHRSGAGSTGRVRSPGRAGGRGHASEVWPCWRWFLDPPHPDFLGLGVNQSKWTKAISRTSTTRASARR